MGAVEDIKSELIKDADLEKAGFMLKYFKAVPGGYGEGDKFYGVKVPFQRRIAKKYYKIISLEELNLLIKDPFHESRLTALFILVEKFEKAKTETEQKKIVCFYLNNIPYINNWDLVDSSAHKILGVYLFTREKDILYELARTNHLWKQRIAVISTFYFIRNNEYEDSLKIARILLEHEHDLIHKAVGWMLREVGNMDLQVELDFLKKHYKNMPRTMLRYAIEKFEPNLRKKYLKGLI